MHTEEWVVLEEELTNLDQRDMEEFDTLASSEKTIAILGDGWWPKAAKLAGDNTSKKNYVIYGNDVMSAQMSEVSLVGVGTVLRLESDTWSMVQ